MVIDIKGSVLSSIKKYNYLYFKQNQARKKSISVSLNRIVLKSIISMGFKCHSVGNKA